jgi:hypothetical protein
MRQLAYRRPLGQIHCSFDEFEVTFKFIVELRQPNPPSMSWTTSMSSLDLARDVDDVRNDMVGQISLEADPQVPLRYPRDAHLDWLESP